ncbi:MAG: PhoH family protein [Geminicoccaceae bacterium]|nr:MAG: PhoH family protein [Geminicoccaceae bacterium]
MVFGQHHENLAQIEQLLDVHFVARGNEVHAEGDDRQTALTVVDDLYARAQRGQEIGPSEVKAAVRLAGLPKPGDGGTFRGEALGLKTDKRLVTPRSKNQAAYLQAMAEHELVFGLGPAGTGKTYLAVAQAVSMLKRNQVERLVLSRPAVEAGERLGFLPGDMKEKVDPYLRPLYDALQDMLHEGKLQSRIVSGEIEIAPLAFMRGRTLSRAFVILDEAQNTTPAQMKMFLTRLGEGSRMVVTGDPSQTDLPPGVTSGLVVAMDRLDRVPGIAMTRFDKSDIVRHPLVSKILDALEGLEPNG